MYTLQMYDNRLEGYRMEASCLLVSNSGKYHLVKQSKTNNNMNTVVLDGTILPPELASLRAILDAPEIVNAPENIVKGEVMMTGGSYLTDLSIPRGAKTQKVTAWRGYRIINHAMTQSVEEHGTNLLKPLREWIKATINEKNAVPTANPPNPRCLPSGQPF
jgi:hypothetical protein